MRVLIVDVPGSGLDLAIRAQKAGHEVKLAVRQVEKQKHIGRGFVPVVDDYRPWLRWANLIVATDNSLYIHDLDRFRKESPTTAVIAANEETAKWEQQRQVGQATLRKAGIPTLPCVEFTDYDSAIAHVKKTGGRYVSKPCGGDSQDKALSYCSSGPADLCYMLQRWKKMQKLKDPFILQEFMPGIEMGVSGWFGPAGWMGVWEENFEFKKLMSGDMGVATGEQGTVLRYTRKSKLADKMLKPLSAFLRKANYVGDVDVNCIIDEKGHPWPLEFTTRLGWPAFQLQLALLREDDPVEWLAALACGEQVQPFHVDRVAIGVILSIPDYPYSHATQKEVVGVPVYGITPSLWPHVHPCEMMMTNAPSQVGDEIRDLPVPATAGDYVLCMTAVGSTVTQVREKVYRRLARIKKQMPSSPMYRTDIGSRLSVHLPKLQKHGYALGLKFND